MWAIYTISMLRALGKFNLGVTVQCVEAIHSRHRIADMFVDNKDMWIESLAAGLDNEKDVLMKISTGRIKLGNSYYLLWAAY